jgi:SAM-dependent methyltransferase
MNAVTVPIWTTNEDGSIAPNVLFHRPWDRLHSRCIEYPFAASEVRAAKAVLDVGTTKSDPAWIQWLASLDIDLHATDYDPMPSIEGIKFHQGDVRHLELPEAIFDCVVAVSVIEHVGLGNAQTVTGLPNTSSEGDVEAVRELVRLLKPLGRLVMTLPFGVVDGLILGGAARCYTAHTIKKFTAFAEPLQLDYYEYQHARVEAFYLEPAGRGLIQRVTGRLAKRLRRDQIARVFPQPAPPGIVTWRRVPLDHSRATHKRHSDGVLCGVWRKR